MTCKDCHHRPSVRYDPDCYGAECNCHCHDTADHATALLAACEEAFRLSICGAHDKGCDCDDCRLWLMLPGLIARAKGE